MTEFKMHLVEIFLPVRDNVGKAFGAEKYAAVRQHLTDRFGGMTAFTRAPAQGMTLDGGEIVHDDIVVFEVMTESLDEDWWFDYRRRLEQDFGQDEILIRASKTTLL